MPTLPMYESLIAETETLRNDIKWLASELSKNRKMVLDLQKQRDSLLKDRETILSISNYFKQLSEKTKGEIEADKLASLVSNADGKKWAAVFCEFNPAMNEEVMVAWFCNAIMCGWDAAEAKQRKGNENEEI